MVARSYFLEAPRSIDSMRGTAPAMRRFNSSGDAAFAQSSGSIPFGGNRAFGLTPAAYKGPPDRTAAFFPATSPS